ncbi:hypothetical protein EYR38_004572 [Pleurotus pulmonarius]|nr:hypothetical protein EYR38_004572 [Pleurotus pulmonarius]
MSKNDENYRNILNLIRGVIVRCFDLNLAAGKQSQDAWDLFWEEIQIIFPTRNDSARASTMRNHVCRYIKNVRGHLRSLPVATEEQTDIIEDYVRSSPFHQSGPMTRSRTASMMILENINLISEEDLVPEFPPPRRCLVPPQALEYQTYEICIVSADSALLKFKSPAPTFPLSDAMGECDPSSSPSKADYHDSKQGESPEESAEEYATDMGLASEETESQSPLASYSPDIYNFLRSCVPGMTHLLPLFVDELGIKDLKSLFAIMRWPSQSRDQYFLNLIRSGKVNSIDAEVIKQRVYDIQTELETC